MTDNQTKFNQEILVGLTEVKTEVRALRADIKDIKDTTKAQIDDHEQRIRQLEKVRWAIAGAAAVGGSILTFLGEKMVRILNG